MKKLPKRRFHLVFSLLTGAMMIFLMTFVITLVNGGWVPDFVARWTRAFLIAYLVGVPVIHFLAPTARSQRTHSANAQTGFERTRVAYGVWDVGGA